MKSCDSKPLGQLCNETSQSIIETVQSLLEKFKVCHSVYLINCWQLFFTTDAEFLRKHSTTFAQKASVKLQQFFLFINIVLLEYEDESSGKEEPKEIRCKFNTHV